MSRRKKRVCRVLKGQFTVEASFIVPLLVFILVGVIYVGLYLHDKTILWEAVNESCNVAESYVSHPYDFETGEIDFRKIAKRHATDHIGTSFEAERMQILKQLKERQKKLFLTQISKTTVEVGMLSGTIEVTGSVRWNYFGVTRFLRMKTIHLKKKYKVDNPAEFARMVSVLKEVLRVDEGLESKGRKTMHKNLKVETKEVEKK
ncbi:MAG: pilus assembly protein [Lachnospiraceae bacterium]|nr:pilus assembly protein [Lachnospiraceae bacterium]